MILKWGFKLMERKHEGRLKYLFQKKPRTKTLAIVFSGFSEKPVYNYVKTLRNLDADRLFLLDDFAYRGSYYMYANGSNQPEQLVRSLINKTIGGGKYNHIITLGSSKGGTCAIFFGLEIGANDIYAGACQYHIGSYVDSPEHQRVFKSMMGDDAGIAEREMLDAIMPICLERHKDSMSKIHLFYSTVEHTYKEHTLDLIDALDRNKISHIDTTATFATHAEVGMHFPSWLKSQLNIE